VVKFFFLNNFLTICLILTIIIIIFFFFPLSAATVPPARRATPPAQRRSTRRPSRATLPCLRRLLSSVAWILTPRGGSGRLRCTARLRGGTQRLCCEWRLLVGDLATWRYGAWPLDEWQGIGHFDEWQGLWPLDRARPHAVVRAQLLLFFYIYADTRLPVTFLHPPGTP
jgi:hypothetical protein